MTVRLVGSTSGYVDLNAPAIAGTTSITFPASNGTVVLTGGTAPVTFPSGNVTNPSITSTTDANSGVWFPAANTIAISTASTERFRVTSRGDVGIGTTTTATPTGYTVLGVNSASTGGIVDIMQGGAYKLRLIGTSSSAVVESASTLPIVFSPAGTEAMRIDSNGKVLVGTSSTFIGASSLQIASSVNEQIAIRSTTAASGRCWRFTADSNNTTYIANQDSVGVYIGNGNSSWSSLSDERTKDIIEPITDAASKVSTLRAVIGKYKTDEEGKRRSFLIAQDVQAVLPEAVSVADQETGYLGLSYTDTIPLLTAALQEALTKIDALEARIAALENA